MGLTDTSVWVCRSHMHRRQHFKVVRTAPAPGSEQGTRSNRPWKPQGVHLHAGAECQKQGYQPPKSGGNIAMIIIITIITIIIIIIMMMMIIISHTSYDYDQQRAPAPPPQNPRNGTSNTPTTTRAIRTQHQPGLHIPAANACTSVPTLNPLQVCYSYFPNKKLNRVTRQLLTTGSWGFACRCEACENELKVRPPVLLGSSGMGWGAWGKACGAVGRPKGVATALVQETSKTNEVRTGKWMRAAQKGLKMSHIHPFGHHNCTSIIFGKPCF